MISNYFWFGKLFRILMKITGQLQDLSIFRIHYYILPFIQINNQILQLKMVI